MPKPTIIVDFDGVIHSYTSGWKGADVIPDPPVEGALEFLDKACEVFEVAIFSSRTNQRGGIGAMRQWLFDHGFDHSRLSFPTHKPPAILTIDDRAICFNGTFPSIEKLQNFKTWQQTDV